MGKGNGKLPRERQARLMALVERSTPDPHRPRLPEEIETLLHDVDVKSAGCYASMEDLADQLENLAQLLDDDNSGVVVGELCEGESVATCLDEVSAQLPNDGDKREAPR